MRVLPFVLILAGCAGAHPTTTTVPKKTTAAGPPPASLVWRGGTHKVGNYSVNARALDEEDSELKIDLAITGADVNQLVRDDVKAAISIGDELTWCEISEQISVADVHGAPAHEPTAIALFRCKVSVAGAAVLVIEVKGSREKLPMNMQPS